MGLFGGRGEGEGEEGLFITREDETWRKTGKILQWLKMNKE